MARAAIPHRYVTAHARLAGDVPRAALPSRGSTLALQAGTTYQDIAPETRAGTPKVPVP